MAATTSQSPLMGPLSLQWIDEVTRNAEAEQQYALAQILAQNAETQYLKAFINPDDGSAAMDKKTFKSKVPMVKYEDIQPLIRRIADGDTSPILCAQPISEFLWSSGTSGEPKLIPSTKEVLDRNLIFFGLLDVVMNMHVKGLDKGKRLNFVFTKSDKKTQGGIPVRLTSSSVYKSDTFKNRPTNAYTSPNEAIYCEDTFQSMYAQLLCGLYEREQVNRIETIFASSLVRVIKFLQLNWQQLTQDIRTGSLNPKVTDPSIRERMTHGLMRPDSELADYISQECAKDNWESIVTRIWPNTKYLGTIVTGTMAQYIPTLDYYSGGLPIASMIYASSECFFGINLDPLCKPSEVSYTFMPNKVYLEFLPHVPDSSEVFAESQLVDLVDVEIGKEYEMVVTTTAGLYRYRVGDIVRATGFYNSAPQFQFVMRKNVVLNIDWEMTKETELQAAIDNASQFLLQKFETGVVDYTSFVDTTSDPDHYVIYWELQAMDLADSPSDNVLEQCCLVMEESFNWAYRRLRVLDKLIGPLEIRVVKNGTFEELMDYIISKGASMSQCKVPRSVGSKKPMFDLLESRVVSKHFSASLPHFSSDEGSEKNLIQE